MLNLLSGLVSGAGLVILWAVLTKSKRTVVWTSAWFDTKGHQENGKITIATEPTYVDPAIWGERRITDFTTWPSDG